MYDYFQQLYEDKTLFEEFLKKERHMHLFVESVTQKTFSTHPVLTSAKCDNDDSCFMLFTTKLFNLFSRNVLKRLNDVPLGKHSNEKKLKDYRVKAQNEVNSYQ